MTKMIPDIVVDIGNSRMKWGRCRERSVTDNVSLPGDDASAWEAQVKRWALVIPCTWVVTSVNPDQGLRFLDWLRQRGDRVAEIRDPSRLPLRIDVLHPEKVGIDRLLNAVAVRARVERTVPAFIVDAGSAVTVDWVDESGTFRGGAIFPGFRLMALALHNHTALLPMVNIQQANPQLPGKSTPAAIEAGVYWAVAGGVKALLRQLTGRAGGSRHREVFLTGGDGHLLAPVMDSDVEVWPAMTLEGIRVAAEALP
jgi:type III pantothenate kinase